jgi:hypothetical protein
MSAPRLAVVSYLAGDPLTPRGARTTALTESLSRDWTIELHSSAAVHAAPPRRSTVRRARKAAAVVRKRVLLDNQEIWSRRHFGAWEPKVDGALLIGWPMSPLVYASERLYAHDIPYVVDVGDPWVLTNPNPYLRRPVAARAIRAERALWARAAGAVLTTTVQANAMSSLYPALPILVRPNGYEPIGGTSESHAEEVHSEEDRADVNPRSRDTLNLVYLGNLSGVLLDVSVLLRRLVDSGRWSEVKFAQYGNDWDGVLDRAPSEVVVTRHKPVPWDQAIALARNYDAAVAIGTQDAYRMRMPSKAVPYLTLPIPRIAITRGADDDALADYVADKQGWVCSTIDDPRLAERLQDHLSRNWSAEELAAPLAEAWPQVADEVARFLARVLR